MEEIIALLSEGWSSGSSTRFLLSLLAVLVLVILYGVRLLYAMAWGKVMATLSAYEKSVKLLTERVEAIERDYVDWGTHTTDIKEITDRLDKYNLQLGEKLDNVLLLLAGKSQNKN